MDWIVHLTAIMTVWRRRT